MNSNEFTTRQSRARALPRLVRAVPKIFYYEARTIAHVDVILISS